MQKVQYYLQSVFLFFHPSIHSSNCIEEQNSQEVIAIQFVFSPYHCWCRYYFTCGVYSLVLALCCNII